MYPKPAKQIDETLDFINASLKGLENGTNLQLVIMVKVSKEFVGCAGLNNIGQVDPELGICRAWGQIFILYNSCRFFEKKQIFL
jgi:hypothetical protein